MTRKEKYQYRKQNGLCVICESPAVSGKTRCAMCAKIYNTKARMRYEKLTPEEKEKISEYWKKWWNAHPEKVAVYNSRKSEYNRRYREGYEW
jgi:hypothetical protein